MVKEHNQFVVFCMGVLDLAVTVGAWLLCFWIRFHSGWFTFVEDPSPGLSYIADVVIISLLLTTLLFQRLGMYRVRRVQSIAAEFWDILRACVAVWVAVVVIGHFLHSAPTSRKLIGMFLVIWPLMMIAYRSSARLLLRFFRRHGRNIRTVAIIGAGRLAQKLLYALRAQSWTGYEVRYFVSDSRIGQEFLGVKVRGPIDRVG